MMTRVRAAMLCSALLSCTSATITWTRLQINSSEVPNRAKVCTASSHAFYCTMTRAWQHIPRPQSLHYRLSHLLQRRLMPPGYAH